MYIESMSLNVYSRSYKVISGQDWKQRNRLISSLIPRESLTPFTALMMMMMMILLILLLLLLLLLLRKVDLFSGAGSVGGYRRCSVQSVRVSGHLIFREPLLVSVNHAS